MRVSRSQKLLPDQDWVQRISRRKNRRCEGASDLPETIHESLCQLHLARMDIRDAVLVQPVLSGPQRGHADHVWRAVLKSPGILVEMERMDRPNAGAAAAHLFDAYVLANTKAADAHAPHERFVAD